MGRRREYPEVPVEIAAQLLRYNPETGEFWWREWPEALCQSATLRKQLNTRLAGKPALTYIDHWGYRVGTLCRRPVKAHRVAWAIHHGAWPTLIDHIDGDKLNNRIANLRDVSDLENARNAALSVRNTSGIVGVGFYQRRWVAHIGCGGKRVILGRFGTKAEAVQARRQAEIDEGYHPNHGNRRAAS